VAANKEPTLAPERQLVARPLSVRRFIQRQVANRVAASAHHTAESELHPDQLVSGGASTHGLKTATRALTYSSVSRETIVRP